MMQSNQAALPVGRVCAEWSRRHELRAESFLHAIPDLMFLIAADGKYLDFQPGKDIQPYVPPSEFLGRHVQEILPASVAVPCQYLIGRAVDTGQMQCLEYKLLMHGEPCQYEARIVRTRPDQVLALVRDVSAFDPALLVHRQARSYFNSLFGKSPEAVAVAYCGTLIYVNAALAALFGYEAEEALAGCCKLDLIAEESRIELEGLMRGRTLQQAGPWIYRTRGLRPDGSEFDLEVRESDCEQSGKIYCVAGFRDVGCAAQTEKPNVLRLLPAAEKRTGGCDSRAGIQTPFGGPLTTREIEVLSLIAGGNSTKEVASILGIAYKTADAHRTHVMEKLGVHETASLVRFAIRSGLIEP